MAITVSARKRLERMEATSLRRIASLEKALQKERDELAAIREAKNGGQKRQLRQIIGDAQPTQKDLVYAELKRKRVNGMTRTEIAERLQQKGVAISPNAVTTNLYRLRLDGLVEFDAEGEVWRVTEAAETTQAGH
jgi:hypothetical protein